MTYTMIAGHEGHCIGVGISAFVGIQAEYHLPDGISMPDTPLHCPELCSTGLFGMNSARTPGRRCPLISSHVPLSQTQPPSIPPESHVTLICTPPRSTGCRCPLLALCTLAGNQGSGFEL